MDDSIQETTLQIVCNMVAVGALGRLRVSELYEALEQQLGSLSQELCTCAKQVLVSAIHSLMTDLADPNHRLFNHFNATDLYMHTHASEGDMQVVCNVSGLRDVPRLPPQTVFFDIYFAVRSIN